jgi:hypothetical protein
MKRTLLPIVFVLCSTLAFAQSESGRAALEGRVNDPSGGAVPNARITAREMSTGFVRETETTQEGQFRMGALPVGTYHVEIEASGFAKGIVDDILVMVGATKTVNLTLQLPTVTTTVTIETSADAINLSDASNSININSKAIEDLPIRGRNFTEFVQLAPNVTQESNRFGIVVNGQRSINSNISLDGVDFNDPLQNGPRGGGPKESAFFFPQMAVREFQVVLNGASAEIGRTNSGYVNVVTKSGTNQYHGGAFYENRSGSLTSPDAFGNDSSSNSQHQFGGSFGGPILKDKLFFFGAAEKNLLTIPYTVKFNAPSGGVVVPQDILSQQGDFDQKNNPLVAFGRLDYQFNTRHSLNVQYTYAAQYGLNFGGVSGQTTAASTNNTLLDRASQGVKAGLTSVLSSAWVNDFRTQWDYDNRLQFPVSPLAQVDVLDLGTLGGNSDGTFIYDAKRYQILDNMSWVRGRHSLKFGVDFNFTPERQQREKNYGGDYTFNTLADYLAARGGDLTKIARYQQTIASNGKQGLFTEMQRDASFFVTDTIKLRRDLTLTAGLRWEGQFNPQPPANPQYPINGQIPNDLRMWQPRLGLAYDVGGKGKTVIRLSAGLFDARTPGYLMQRVFTDNGSNTVVLDSTVDANVLKFLTVPQPIAVLPASLKVAGSNAIYAFDPTFRNPRSGQASIAVEQQIDRSTRITIGFNRNSTWALQRRLDVNLFQPTVLPNGFPVYPTYDSKGNLVQASGWSDASGPIFVDSTGKTLKPAIARPDPNIGQFNVNKSIGHSSYNGLYIALQRRLSHRVQFGANYTYARNRDDDSNERDFNRQYELNTYYLKGDAGWAKNDIRHNANFNVLYDLGRGFTVSSLLITHSGSPGRYVLGTDLQNDGNKDNDRPVINGLVASRDSVRLPHFFDWDMRLLKEFKLGETMRLGFSIEGFNLTRAKNTSFSSDGDSLFGKPQATINPNTGFGYANNAAGIPQNAPGTDRFGGPRQAQLGVRLVF